MKVIAEEANCSLETFLGGMETVPEMLDELRSGTLKPSLVEWKQRYGMPLLHGKAP